MERYGFAGLVLLLLLATLAASPAVGGSNDTWDPSYYLTHKETLAGQKDMSQYNHQVTPVPIHTMDPETARLYPHVTACGKNGCLKTEACPFPFLRCNRTLTVMVMYNLNETRPVSAGPVANASLSGEIFSGPANLYRDGIPEISLLFFPHPGAAP